MSGHDHSDGSGSKRSNARVVLPLVVLVVGMVGLSFAAVPLYRLFCQVTGFGGTTQRAEAGADHVLDRTITVRFDSNVAGDLPWSFRPEMTTMKVKLGETAQMAYIARSTGDRPTVGTSTFNVSPPSAGIYFNKIECFCFTEQPLAAGEQVDMPVVFFVDPAFADDKDTRGVSEITLSYTFFPVETGEDKPLAAAPETDEGRSPL